MKKIRMCLRSSLLVLTAMSTVSIVGMQAPEDSRNLDSFREIQITGFFSSFADLLARRIEEQALRFGTMTPDDIAIFKQEECRKSEAIFTELSVLMYKEFAKAANCDPQMNPAKAAYNNACQNATDREIADAKENYCRAFVVAYNNVDHPTIRKVFEALTQRMWWRYEQQGR